MKKFFVNVQIVMLGLFAIISFTATAQSPKLVPYSIFLPVVIRPQETPIPTTTPTQTTTLTLSPTSTFTSTPTQTASPTTPPPATSGDIRITYIFFDGTVSSYEPDEYVEIKNFDAQSIQIHNWTLRDLAEHVYTFPEFVMAPNQICRVYTNQDHPDFCSFSYGSGQAIWNNSGDTAYLRNSAGSLIDDYTY